MNRGIPIFLTQTIWAVLAVGTCSSAYASEQYAINLAPNNFVQLSAFGRAPISRQASSKIEESLSGKEKSECRDYGRQSAASATADVRITSKRDDGISLELVSNATSFGGHFRTCGTCVLYNCIGIFGNDTKANASARATAVVSISFSNDATSAYYVIDIGTTSQENVSEVVVSDSNGNKINSIPKQKGSFQIEGGPAKVYYVTATIQSAAENEGGCCSEKSNKQSIIDLNVRKAPLLASLGKFEPFIKGGAETKSYKNVGAILINGQLHCTGTIVGPHTVLTAAHCVDGFQKQLSAFTFIIGSNLLQPTFGPEKIVEFAFPDGSQPGYKFNEKTLEDDIATLYLENATSIVPATLHNGSPQWSDIEKNQTNLIFVGFGFDVIENQPIGSGIKREGAWYIESVENRRVRFSVPGKNTCKGDSGGPAFLVVNGKIVQMAVTSGGSPDCTSGFETRIDAFSDWLKGRVR